MNEEEILEQARDIGRNMFVTGAREVAMMALDGELDVRELRATIEATVERARERAIARTPDVEWLREPARG